MQPLRIVVAGAAGRMGRAVIRAVSECDDLRLAGALGASGRDYSGKDAGEFAACAAMGVAVTDNAQAVLANADAVVDFTTPQVSVQLAQLAATAGVAHVIGTTGFSSEQQSQIARAAAKTAIVKSGNMSRGVTLLAALVRRAAKALPDFDIEILEMHHRNKVDAPSGTALLLGRAAADARGISLDENSIRGRDGNTGRRPDNAIGFTSLRGGTVVGEHDVIFAGPHERVVLSHSAEDRSIFARGALAAARWAQGKPAGLYGMADVLGLSA
jgi:4-hydroxy-tetrahydrodipicolinate reductase